MMIDNRLVDHSMKVTEDEAAYYSSPAEPLYWRWLMMMYGAYYLLVEGTWRPKLGYSSLVAYYAAAAETPY